MTNKQDEGMTIEKAREIVEMGKINGFPTPIAYGFIEGWNARGVKDAGIIQNATPPPLTENIAILMAAMMYWEDEILKLQSEGDKCKK